MRNQHAPKILSLVILVLLTSVNIVISRYYAPSEVQLLTSGSGEATWKGHFIELEIDQNPAGNMDSWAKIKISCELNFDDVHSFSFRYFRIIGSRTPRLTLELDTDADEIGDFWVIQWTGLAEDGCRTHELDDWYVYPHIYGDTLVHRTLSQIQEDIDGDVVAIKLILGLWNHIDAHRIRVCCVRVNDEHFIEPPKEISIFFNLIPNPAMPCETVELKGILLDELIQPILSAEIRIYCSVNSGLNWHRICTLVTNEFGLFYRTFMAPASGLYLIRASYGDSSSTTYFLVS